MAFYFMSEERFIITSGKFSSKNQIMSNEFNELKKKKKCKPSALQRDVLITKQYKSDQTYCMTVFFHLKCCLPGFYIMIISALGWTLRSLVNKENN